MEITYGNTLAIIAVAVMAPIIAGLTPKLRFPAVALEIVLGIILGPAVLNLVHIDVTVDVLQTIGVAYLLFLAGLEIDLTTVHGKTRLLFGSWGISCVLALVIAGVFHALDLHDAILIVAIALTSTSLGLVVPVLREAGHTTDEFGQTVMAESSVAEFGALLLLTVFYSGTSESTGVTVMFIVGFCILATIVGLTVAKVSRIPSVWPALERLADSSSQLSVRAMLVVLLLFLAIATRLGLEAILGAFVAGALLRFLDREGHLENPSLKPKIEAIGYGFLVPIFFVTSGVTVDVDALRQEPKHMVLIPLFLVAMFVVRGLPTLLFSKLFDRRQVVSAALLHSTNLTFVVIVASVGVQTGALDSATGGALLIAGVLSVLIYPPLAIAALQTAPELQADWDEPD